MVGIHEYSELGRFFLLHPLSLALLLLAESGLAVTQAVPR